MPQQFGSEALRTEEEQQFIYLFILTFRGPCIVIYSYNKINELASSQHNLYDIYPLLLLMMDRETVRNM